MDGESRQESRPSFLTNKLSDQKQKDKVLSTLSAGLSPACTGPSLSRTLRGPQSGGKAAEESSHEPANLVEPRAGAPQRPVCTWAGHGGGCDEVGDGAPEVSLAILAFRST